jgi:DNA-binding PadR family transcriptional regulator
MRPNPNDLTVLGLLANEPLHPYEMARRMQEWHIEEFTGSRRSALYHAVGRLVRAGHIEELQRDREGARPERTTYAITDAGRRHLLALLREMISTPERELPSFVAGLTFMSRLEPADAAEQLERRAERLREEVEALEAARASSIPADLPRVYAIEHEHVLLMRRTELEWVEAVAADARDGRLTWAFGDHAHPPVL